MAWQGNVGKHQYRKEATAAQRSNIKLAALHDAQDAETPPKKSKRTKKTLGLRFYWQSAFQKRETSHASWYATEQDRAKAKASGAKELTHQRTPRFTRIEEIER